MLKVLLGENSFDISVSKNHLVKELGLSPENINAESLAEPDLPSLFLGATLFSDKRLITITNLSDNKPVWDKLPDYMDQLADSSDTHVIITEVKLDKRSKTYKALKKRGCITEITDFGTQSHPAQLKWLQDQAKEQGLDMSKDLLSFLLDRVGANQWQLLSALDKLSLYSGKLSEESISKLIEPSTEQGVFSVFETAISGDKKATLAAIKKLELTEDPYRFFGLISNQAFMLATLRLSGKTSAEVAKDLGAHPFMLSKMQPMAGKLSPKDAKDLIHSFAKADLDIKTSGLDPWMIIKTLLLKVANN